MKPDSTNTNISKNQVSATGVNKTQIPNDVVNNKVKYSQEKSALSHVGNSTNGHKKRFSKTIFIPVLILIVTVVMGAIVVYTVFKTSSNDSVAPTVPGKSEAGVCLTDVIEIKNDKYLSCVDNTCSETEKEGELSCAEVGEYAECFKCENLVATPNEGLPPLEVIFNGSAQSQNEVSYTLDFGDGTDKLETDDPTNIKHKYNEVGVYTAKLLVTSTDSSGETISDTCQTNVSVVKEQVRPVCVSLTANPQVGTEPLKVTFTAKGTGTDPLTYKYVFGDGQEITSAKDTIEHTYTKASKYTAKLYIISNGKQSSEVQNCVKTIEVTKEPVEESHLVCKTQACVKVPGAGKDDCTTNGDCFRYACVDEACQKIDGKGEDTCKSDTDCKPTDAKHLVCKTQACVQVDGEGTDECSKDTDCYYLACVDESCTKLDGDKQNTCSTDTDCSVPEEKKTHLVCKDEACVEVEGDGENSCKSDADCKKETRLICKNQACVEVYGKGENECKTNSDCIVTTTTTTTTEKEKPIVPKTGIEQTRLYILVSVGLIASGALILTRKIF